MKQLLVISRGIDMLNTWIGKGATWLILATVVISAGNAMMRKFFGEGSNALLEIQWYFFAAVFTLGSGYAFL
jgi:TRAP-type mannitol/chloroaromatic compound transport system permease small subunit